TILLGVRWSSKIIRRQSRQKGLRGMRVFAIAVAFSLMLAPGAFAQGAAPGTQKPPAPAAPATQKPPAPAAPVAPAPPSARFQDGLKYAYVNMQAIAQNSAEGKALADRLKTAQDAKQRELQDKNKNLQAMQQKLDQGGSVLSEAARTQLQTDIDRT